MNKKTKWSIILFFALLFFAILSSNGHANDFQPWLEEIPKKKLPSEAKKAARQLLKSISIPPTAIVYFLGPVRPGTLIEEDLPPHDEQIVRLEVPSGPGTYYVFYIDDEPDFRFAHPVRYAWVNLETGEVRSVDAEWWPEISEPGMPPIKIKPSGYSTVNDVLFIFGERGEEK